MTTKRIMGIITFVIVVIIVGFIFILYATIKTKSTSLNKYEPFKECIGQTVTLNKQTVLFKDKIPMNNNSDYPYMLLDSLHPQWRYVDERKNIGDIEQIVTFPEGTQLKIEKAIQYTNGVSGSSYPMIFGTITAHGMDYKTGYQWGERNVSKAFEKIEKCWFFHQSPWQTSADRNFYALPTASWW